LSAELPGFQTVVMENVVLEVSSQLRMNFTMKVASLAQDIDVVATADTALAVSTASIGAVIPEQRVRDLPLVARDVLALVVTQPGLVGGNFAGGRLGSLQVTRDGVSVGDERIN